METKICPSCGRSFQWRKKWARDWEQVRYCSAACRRRRLLPVDTELESAILDLLDGRSTTICPSEAARRVDADHWRSLMEPTRRAARRLAADGVVEITQGGRVVDPASFVGPVRIRRSR